MLPVALPDRYGVLVPKVDRDGNETSGVVLPAIAVPTATSTGWSVRSANAGGAGELCCLDGAYLPFTRTKAEREATGDGRLSLEERYHGAADYAAKVRAAALALARQGSLLDEDVERIQRAGGGSLVRTGRTPTRESRIRRKLIFVKVAHADLCKKNHMFEPTTEEHDPYDPTHCHVCGRATRRVRMIWRTFQDDLEVWECPSCGTSIAQAVNLAKLVRQASGSLHLN